MQRGTKRASCGKRDRGVKRTFSCLTQYNCGHTWAEHLEHSEILSAHRYFRITRAGPALSLPPTLDLVPSHRWQVYTAALASNLDPCHPWAA